MTVPRWKSGHAESLQNWKEIPSSGESKILRILEEKIWVSQDG